MTFAVTTVNLDHFFSDLREGDVFTWCIVGAVVFFTLLSAYQKVRGARSE